jgi:hypothetical protein
VSTLPDRLACDAPSDLYLMTILLVGEVVDA